MKARPTYRDITGRPWIRQSEGGQIVLEYVLLLIIAVSIAFLITNQMVSRNPQSPGFLVQKWKQIITVIATDTADEVNPGGGGG